MERLFFSRLSHSAVAPPLTQTLPELFRPLKSWLELNHIPGMVVYVPDLSAKGGPASPEAKKMESLYREACRINGLVYHDLSPALSAGPPQSLLWQPTEPFLNALGQRKAAQSISGRLQKFLPRQLSAKKKDKPALRQ